MIGKRIDQQGKSNSCLFVICVFSLKQHNRFKTAFALAGGPAFNTQFNSDTSNTTRSHNTTTTNTTTSTDATFNLSINDNTSIVKGLQARNLETSLNDKLAATGRTVTPGDLYAVTVRRGRYQDGVPYQAGQMIQPAGDGSVTHILEAFGVSAGGETINFKRVSDAELRKMESGAAEGENVAEVAGDGGDGELGSIRAYKGIDETTIPIEYRADPRLVIDMAYKGIGVTGTNAAGWERNANKFFSNLVDRNPNLWSKENIDRVYDGIIPIVDDVFVKNFPQYIKYLNDALRHHHIGGGGQAVALPESLHKGFGGIHNFEKEYGIWGNNVSADSTK